MAPFYATLTPNRQLVLDYFFYRIGFLDFIGRKEFIAAIKYGNVARVCAELGDKHLEKIYREG
jgi:hypothetical protein